LPGIEYYYKLFSFHKGFYSKGLLLPASTLCIDFYELPFNQGFEDFGGSKPGTCWQVMKNTEMDGGISGQHLLPLDASDELLSWQINKQDTNNGEGTEFISSGKQSIRIPTEATDYNWLISPEIQLESGYADLIFTPWYMTNGYLGGKSTNFKVLVYAQSSWNLELEWERNPNNQMNKMVELNLDNYKGQLIQIAFVYVGNNTYPMALDEIAVLGGAGIRPYDITFKINYQGEPLANATVNFNETAITTDSTGMAIFVDQLPASNLAYTVLKEDFQSQTGLVSIVDKDITIELNLWLVGITTNVDNAIRVFPNPVSQSFTIQTNISEVMNYELYSLTGKLIKAGFVINNANIHTSNLANGLYYLSLKSATKSLTVKIIKQ